MWRPLFNTLHNLLQNYCFLVGFWGFELFEIPLYLSRSWKPEIASCFGERFWSWSWLYSRWLWCRRTYWFDNAVCWPIISDIVFHTFRVLFSQGLITTNFFPLTFRCVLEPGDKILDCPPTFTMYEFDAAVNGALVVKGNLLSLLCLFFSFSSSWIKKLDTFCYWITSNAVACMHIIILLFPVSVFTSLKHPVHLL